MKKMTRKAIAALSSLCLLCSAASGLAASADFSEDVLTGTFYQETTLGLYKTTGIETYSYSDSFFKGNATEYQPALASASACLAIASANSTRLEDANLPDRDIRAFLEDIGFSNVKANEDFNIVPTADTMGVACGMRTITDENGKDVTLIAVAPRCGGYGAEWASNFRIGTDGNAAGFSESSQKVLSFLKDYVQSNAITGDVKVWISGYSRAAAVANLTAASLIDDAASVFGDAAVLAPDQVFAYTFATPMAADVSNAPRGEKYQNIHNIISRNDLITYLAPSRLEFDRYGTDHVAEEMASQSDMMRQYQQIDSIGYLGFLTGKSPEAFQKRLLGIAVDGSTGTYPADENSTNQLPATQEEFVQLIADSMTYSIEGRADYAETIEPYLSELAGILIPGLIDGSSGQLSETVSQSNYGLALLTYLYMDYELSRIPYVLEEYPDNPEQAELFFNKTNRMALALRVMAGDLTFQESLYVQAFVSNLNPEEAQWIQDVFGDFSPEAIEEAKKKTGFADWNFSDECKTELKSIFSMYCSFLKPAGTEKRAYTDPETGETLEKDVVVYAGYTPENYETETAFVKAQLAANYKGFMTELLTAAGVPAEVIAHQTEDTACASMPEYFAYLLLGSTDRKDIYAEDIEDGESVSKLATILGNAENFVLAHTMGHYLAWVRAADENYDGFTRTADANSYGYHRLRIEEDSEDAVISGKVYDKDGTLTASFADNKLLSSTNSWIRMQDGCLRLPFDQAFTVEITSSDTANFSLAVEEYSTYDGMVKWSIESNPEDSMSNRWRSLNIAADDTYTLYVPAMEVPVKDWAETSFAYRLDKQEAAPPEEQPTEPAKEQPTSEEAAPVYSEDQLCEMALRDYYVKTGVNAAKAKAGKFGDLVEIVLTDENGEKLDVYTIDPDTAKGQDNSGGEVDLPQTGVTSRSTVLAVGGALGLIAAGAWLTGRSMRKKETE